MTPLLNGYKININGKGTKTNSVTDNSEDDEHVFHWFHLDIENKNTRPWLEKNCNLSDLIISNLLIAESRPNLLTFNEGTLLTLRGMNFNENSEPEDMVSLNIWIEGSKVITTSSRRIFALEDIVKHIKDDEGPTESSMFVAVLIKSLNRRVKEVILNIDDVADELEKQILENDLSGARSKLIALRKKILTIRRYLLPQREVLNRLHTERFFWIDELGRLSLRDNSERLIRYLEDLDMIRDHISLTQEELNSSISEQMNQTLYVLGIVSALFLPLGFLTGLLGINVGGLPGVENPNSFLIVCLISVVFLVLGYVYFKIKKKI